MKTIVKFSGGKDSLASFNAVRRSALKYRQMKARIRYVSNDSVTKMNFETIEDLLKWKTEIDEKIIIEEKMPWFEDEDYDIYIQVYDDYKE